MTNFIKYISIIGMIATGLACEKKTTSVDSKKSSAEMAAEVTPAPSEIVGDRPVAASEIKLVASGNTVTTAVVIDHLSTVGETPAGEESMSWEEIIVAYPALADRVLFLGKVDKVIETDARSIDLYIGERIVVTLKYSEAGDTLTVFSTTQPGFAADLITFETMVDENQKGAVIDTLDFMMSACLPTPQAKAIREPSADAEAGDKTDMKCAAVVTTLGLRLFDPKAEETHLPPPVTKEETIPEPVPVPGPVEPA